MRDVYIYGAARTPRGRGKPGKGALSGIHPQELLAQCRVETFRAGGPGGQHQNRTESAVRLVHLPTGIRVVAREERSQHRNRARALERLRAALEERARTPEPRVPTQVPARERKRSSMSTGISTLNCFDDQRSFCSPLDSRSK